jgi:hypothetical protein
LDRSLQGVGWRIVMSNELAPTAKATSNLNSFADCMRAAGALQANHVDSILMILSRAAAIGISDLEANALINELHRTTGVGKRQIKKSWDKYKEDADAERAAKAAEEYARHGPARAAQQQQAKDEYRERLWQSCRVIAEYPNLLAGMTATIQSFGVVGEGPSIRGAYLACSSRFLRRRAISLLRRGAPSGGKNYLLEMIFLIIPDEDIVRISGSSPLALIYYGDEDEDAFKYKIIYVPEAAIMAEKQGVESPLAIMLRVCPESSCGIA